MSCVTAGAGRPHPLAMTESPQLVAIASAIDDLPTIEQIDAMMVELSKMDRSYDVEQTENALLEIRAGLAKLAA